MSEQRERERAELVVRALRLALDASLAGALELLAAAGDPERLGFLAAAFEAANAAADFRRRAVEGGAAASVGERYSRRLLEPMREGLRAALEGMTPDELARVAAALRPEHEIEGDVEALLPPELRHLLRGTEPH